MTVMSGLFYGHFCPPDVREVLELEEERITACRRIAWPGMRKCTVAKITAPFWLSRH